MRNLIHYKKGHSSWARWIAKRIKNNLNFICVFVGGTGSGKSYSCLRTCELIAKEAGDTFEARQCVFDFKSMMKVINSEWFKLKKIKLLMFDEMQISAGSRQWQSLSNKQINFLLSTFRNQNVILFMCLPYFSMLDSNVRKLCHGIFEMRSINRRNKLATFRPKLLDYAQFRKDPYQHALYVKYPKTVKPLRQWTVTLPSEQLRKDHEEVKDKFTASLNTDIERELGKLEPKDTRKPLTALQRQAMELIPNMKMEDVAKKMGVKIRQVYRHKEYACKKGYTPEEFI